METAPTRYEALQQVAARFPSQQAMADAFGVSQPTIWRWLNQAKQIPPTFALLAESLTGISRHHLRPDIYPPEIPAAPARFCGVDHTVPLVAFNRGVALRDGALRDGASA